MTAKHSKARPAPITERLVKGTTPVLSAHLAFVVHADGSLSWHVGRMDPASRRMTFPYSGVTQAPRPSRPEVVTCLTAAMNELLDLQELMAQ